MAPAAKKNTAKKNTAKKTPTKSPAKKNPPKKGSTNKGVAAQISPPPAKEPLLKVQDLHMHFPVTQGVFLQRAVGQVKAVDGISFEIAEGETLGLVGESGCGKTTTGRCILQLTKPTSGQIFFRGRDLNTCTAAELREARKQVQVIFQDPYSSLNPRMTIGDIIGEGPRVHGITDGAAATETRAKELLGLAGLPTNLYTRFPHELSGGQRQRVGIARALSVNPSFIVCDEAVSALDVSIQAQIINLLEDLQQEFGLTYLFIAHDLSVVRHLSHRVAVMYLGKMAELATSEALYKEPLHPYTLALLSAVPIPDPAVEEQREHIILQGEVPSPLNPPPGCVFHPRCSRATDRCRVEMPVFEEKTPGHWAACHHTE